MSNDPKNLSRGLNALRSTAAGEPVEPLGARPNPFAPGPAVGGAVRPAQPAVRQPNGQQIAPAAAQPRNDGQPPPQGGGRRDLEVPVLPGRIMGEHEAKRLRPRMSPEAAQQSRGIMMTLMMKAVAGGYLDPAEIGAPRGRAGSRQGHGGARGPQMYLPRQERMRLAAPRQNVGGGLAAFQRNLPVAAAPAGLPVRPGVMPAIRTQQVPMPAGARQPEWVAVKHTPLFNEAVVQAMGAMVFADYTTAPVGEIVCLSTLTHDETTVKAVAAWAMKEGAGRDESTIRADADIAQQVGRRFGMNIDGRVQQHVDEGLRGYEARIVTVAARGMRYLIMKDFAGTYVYGWPDSLSAVRYQGPEAGAAQLRGPAQPPAPAAQPVRQLGGPAAAAQAPRPAPQNPAQQRQAGFEPLGGNRIIDIDPGP